ncbi:MAG: divergent polysaccharide deacetylase family protein [Gammaproteobacteria bacterium]|nr:divergent polysaccharide deacetylase family protein [Gammaproteobacteria bacterium]
MIRIINGKFYPLIWHFLAGASLLFLSGIDTAFSADNGPYKKYYKPGSRPPTMLGQLAPVIGIIIDDLGNSEKLGLRAVLLPGPVTMAFLPHTPYAYDLANMAHRMNKEVMLHLPMQAINQNKLGPGGLTQNMSYGDFYKTFINNLQSIPHVIGINNHMGSLLTQHSEHMQWLMQTLREHDQLFFVDSYTTRHSIAHQTAKDYWIPNMRRDIFLDNDRRDSAINLQFDQLLSTAKKNGYALAIGHPYPQTLRVLRNRIASLKSSGVKLTPVSQLLYKYVRHPNRIND